MGIFDSKKKREARMMAPQWLRIMHESANIAATTTKPDVFFSRIDLMQDMLFRLASVERYVKFSDLKPSELLSRMPSDRQEMVCNFIQRLYNETQKKIASLSTEKARIGRANAYIDTLNLYASYMDSYAISLANNCHSALLRQAQTPAGQKIPN